MFETNDYYNGQVKSIAFNTQEGRATVGVMAPGEFLFSTTTVEFMTVTSGLMSVLLPGDSEWRDYREFETFRVEKNVQFKVRIAEETSYRCLYQ